ncbi:unnamed protein product [Scytosiphon promiscuus]
MSKRGPKRSSGGGKDRHVEAREPPGPRGAHLRDRAEGGRATHKGILGKGSMSLPLLLPRHGAGPPSGADTSTRNILAGIKRRKEGGTKRRRRMTAGAGIVVVFSALCAALLWVGVGSFSQRPAAAAGFSNSSTKGPGTEGKARSSRKGSGPAAAAAAATTTAAAATAGNTKTGASSPEDASGRNLARRPELKTRGGQLAFAPFTLLAEYPHDPLAFTQGLCFEGGFLYESTGLFGGKSTVRKVDTETGNVLQSIKLGDKYFGEGMVIVENEIHSLTWRSGVGFTWDLETFAQRGKFDIKTKTGQGWGITSDGNSLIVSDGTDFAALWCGLFLPALELAVEIGQVKLPDGRPLKKLNELEMVKGYVFANVWFDEHLYKIDPNTGTVVDVYNFSELYPKARTGPTALQKKELSSREAVLNGIAWDPEEDVLYLTGKLWPRMYKVKLREGDDDDDEGEGPESGSDSERRRQ